MTCVECAEPITNPLCPACLQEGILQWLREQGKEELAGAVEERTLQVFSNYGETFCIKCSAQMSLCAYCYTKEIFGIVKGHPELLDQYLVYFNFDLGHLGWEKDAEEVMEENAWKL